MLGGALLMSSAQAGLVPAPPPAVQVPTLVVSGESDRGYPPAVARALAAAVPGAELALLPDAGHMLPVTHPDILADRIAAFVGVGDAR